MISRYADRLAMLAQLSLAHWDKDTERFVAEVFVTTKTHVEYPRTPEDISVQVDAYG